MNAARTIHFAHARPAEILAARHEPSILWLPVGPLEWHGPHLPFGVDALNAEATALACAARMGGLVLPTLYCGTERERGAGMLADLGIDSNAHVIGMDFPAHSVCSGYFPEEEFALQVRGWIDRAAAWEFDTLVIVNGHGAANHNATLHRLVQANRTVQANRPAGSAIAVLAFLALVADAAGDLNIGHASADETALMLLDCPEDVAINMLPAGGPLLSAQYGIVDDRTFRGEPEPGFTLRREDDPRFHSHSDRGRAVRERTVGFICSRVGAFLTDPSAPRTNLAPY